MALDDRSSLEIAKDALRIPELWIRRDWPGKPGKSCRCPYRADKSASGSVIPASDGMLFKDFATGKVFDAPGLLAEVEGIGIQAACRLFIRLAAVSRSDRHPASPTRESVRSAEPRSKPQLPPLRMGTAEEYLALAKLRHVSVEAVKLAGTRGLLFFAESVEGPAWILTDQERKNAIARRLDGSPWDGPAGNPKAKTLRGCWASWPVGVMEAQNFPNIALVEGTPDALSAFHFAIRQSVADRTAVVSMAGAGMTIPECCLPHFKGKNVRIFVHDDAAGRVAFDRWSDQLRQAGATVDGVEFAGLFRNDGAPVKDLNDLCLVGAESLVQWTEFVNSCMRFGALNLVGAVPETRGPMGGGLLTASEHDLLADAGFANDPLILRAVEIFNGRIVRDGLLPDEES